MCIHIDIKLDLTPTQKKVMRWAVVAGTVIGALGIGLAIGAPHQWMPKDPLNASDLNDLNVVTNGTSSISVGGTTYCGTSTSAATGYFGSYSAAKTLCEASAGCGTSKTAHMCDADELIRSAQIGKTITPGWYSSGNAQDLTVSGGAYQVIDCGGWNSTNAMRLSPAPMGPYWGVPPGGPPGGAPEGDACGNSHVILCCD